MTRLNAWASQYLFAPSLISGESHLFATYLDILTNQDSYDTVVILGCIPQHISGIVFQLFVLSVHW